MLSQRFVKLYGCSKAIHTHTVSQLRFQNQSSKCRRRDFFYNSIYAASRQRSYSLYAKYRQDGGGDTLPRVPLVDVVSDKSDKYIKHCVKLRDDARYRYQNMRCLVVGALPILEMFDATLRATTRPDKFKPFVHTLFMMDNGQEYLEIPAQNRVRVTQEVMRHLSGMKSGFSIDLIAELNLPPAVDYTAPQWEKYTSRILVLEQVRDPGNMGTLMRTALALGWQSIFLLPGCCDPFNDKSLRAAQGALFKLCIQSGRLEKLQDIIQQHKITLVAAEPNLTEDQAVEAAIDNNSQSTQQEYSGKLYNYQQANNSKIALVLGNEGQGLSEEILQMSKPIQIPMYGAMESLNVAMAGSILMSLFSKGFDNLLDQANVIVGESNRNVNKIQG